MAHVKTSAMLPYTRAHPHLAKISGRCLSRISLPGCRQRITCRVDTYHRTVLPRPKSSVRPHVDRKLRPMANFVSTTVFFYNIRCPEHKTGIRDSKLSNYGAQFLHVACTRNHSEIKSQRSKLKITTPRKAQALNAP